MKPIEQVKSAIIGKMWDNKAGASIMPSSHKLTEETTFKANQSFLIGDMTFRTDRNLPKDIKVEAGKSLYFYTNKKREGKRDADYSVSIVLPEAEAQSIIDGAKQLADKWRADNS